MREPITVDEWSVIRFSRKGEAFFCVVTGLDQNSSGICSGRIIAVKGDDVPQSPYEDTGNILHFRRPRITVTDDRRITYRLLKKAPKDAQPWAALVALLKWCGNRYRPGEFGHSTVFALKDSLRAENIFGDGKDNRPGRKPAGKKHADKSSQVERPDESGHRTGDMEQPDSMEIVPAREREMGPAEVTCLECSWVSFALTRAEAEREIARFNAYFDRLSTQDQQRFYGGRRSSLASYCCIHCGNADEMRFRRAKPEDCPDGVTLNPVICEHLARPDWD